MASIPVVVAVRCRPLVAKEREDAAKSCVIVQHNQVVLDCDRHLAFTFDHTFSATSNQKEVYSTTCGSQLINNLFKGYNVTVLAYGQTGSGKTHTMGTGYFNTSDQGIVPRAVEDIFSRINHMQDKSIACSVSFLEVYNEEIYDLFNMNTDREVLVREDLAGIKIVGLKEIPVTTVEQVFQLLTDGSVKRKTGKTNMNQHSSRSHAIFTLMLEQKALDGTEVCISKFHFVDLAGSERAKKTGALGARFKEGININRGLLALGNVISSLCDGCSHIPYRDSKLTRLLQDSLGGNSYTVMVACISPADSNLEETLNTLRYADRAKKIKNKPIINKDPKTKEIEELRGMLTELQKKIDGHMKKCPLKDSSPDLINSGTAEEEEEDLNSSLAYTSFCIDDLNLTVRHKEKLKSLKQELKRKDFVIKQKDLEIKRTLLQFGLMCRKVVTLETENSIMKHQLAQIGQKAQIFVETAPVADESISSAELQDFKSLIATTLEMSEQKTPQCSPMKVMHLEDLDDASEVMVQGESICLELQQVESEIQRKEFLLSKTLQSNEEILKMKVEHEAAITALKEELHQKEKEKETLEAMKNPLSRLNEDRRLKIKDLQNQIELLQKKLKDKANLLLLKKEQEKKVQALDKEIQSLKSARVRLMKQMDYESKRSLHLMSQMKRMETQKDREKTKMDLAMMKQKAANDLLERKLQDAQQARKRLQDSLNKQRMMVQERAKFMQKGVVATAERIKQWLLHDVNVEVCRQEAREHVETLKEDRSHISREIRSLEERLAAGKDDEQCRSRLTQQIGYLQNELESRTAHMKSIHKDILSGGDELSEQSRWNNIQRITEAKCGLALLFDQVVQLKLLVNRGEQENKQAKTELQNSQFQVDELKREVTKNNLRHKQEINQLKQEQEEKTLFLLKEVGQEKEPSKALSIDRLEYLHQELIQKTEECSALQMELEMYKQAGENKDSKPIKKPSVGKSKTFLSPLILSDSEDDEMDDSHSNDPDWKKTPFTKRAKKCITTRNKTSDSDSGGVENQRRGMKRSTSSTTCGCKGSCNRGNCGCKKNYRYCDEHCKCAEDICVNRPSTVTDPMQDESEAAASNTTFMAGPILNQIQNRTITSGVSTFNYHSTPLPKLDSKRIKYKDGNSSFFKPLHH